MALVLADRVKETTTTTGTGTVTLLGASTGFQSFAVVGNTNTTYYTIAAQTGTEWEVGIGTYTLSGTTLARTTVLSSSNSGSPVNFSAGTKDVFVTYPSSRSVYANGTVLTATNSSILPVTSGGTGVTTSTGTTNVVLSNSPTLVTPALGAATATSIVSSGTAASSFTVTSGSAVPLTITNVGTGNSFVVEDSASTDSTPFIVNGAGQVSVNAPAVTNYQLTVAGTYVSAGTASTVIGANGTIPQASTVAGIGFFSSLSTEAAAFTLGALQGFSVSQGTIGATSAVTNQYGFIANSTLTGATNNYGFFSNIASGTNRFNFYAGGTADNFFAGSVGIGGAPYPGINLLLNKAISGNATISDACASAATVMSDVTGRASVFGTFVGTQAAAFTLTNLRHFSAAQAPIGAGSAVTNQYGFFCENNTGATNNYGLVGNIAAAANRWNFYAVGTAANYFAGVSQFAAGTAALPGITQISDLNTGIFFPAADTLGFTTGGTERVRIDSVGAVGIGAVPITGANLTVAKAITGAVDSYGVYNSGEIKSDVTVSARYFQTAANTQAAAFTVARIQHFLAVQSTIGATSAVTNQFGFDANSSLTGATNNYGFYSNIASTANRFNFYAAGTADNYFSGSVGIGAVPFVGAKVNIGGSATGSTTVYGILNQQSIQSDVTANAVFFGTSAFTAASVSLTHLYHYSASQATFSGTVVTNQYGYRTSSAFTGATNNYGFYGDIAAAANRWNFYANGTAANLFSGVSQFAAGTAALPGITQISDLNTGIFFPAADTLGFTTGGSERVRIDSVGAVGIGGTPAAGQTLFLGKLVTGAVNANVLSNVATIASDVTTVVRGYFSSFSTQAAAFTLPNLQHFYANQSTIGAASAVSNQYGFVAESTLTGATANFGFLSNIAAAANRYNFYAAGSAINYFAGVVQTNAATAIPAGGTAGAGVTVSSTANFGVFFGSGAPTLTAAKGSLYLRSDGTTVNDRMYVNTNGSTTWTNVVTSA